MTKSGRILITGGSGFIGKHLILYLLKQGHKNIKVVDIIPPKIPGITFTKVNFSDLKIIPQHLENVETVIHLAAMVGVDRCRLDPHGVRNVNITQTKKFINMCIKAGVKKLIFTSSSEVYGNSNKIPYVENSRLHPISEYAKSKVAIENYLKNIQQNTDMSVGIVRFFNVYGQGQRKDFVIPKFIDRALRNKPLEILGDGSQTRCFTYVKDAIRGLYLLIKYNKKRYVIFNIGSSGEFTISEIAEIILKCLPNSKSIIKHIDYGKSTRESFLEISRRVPDVSKAKRTLGFVAHTKLVHGIKAMIAENLI